MVIVPVTEYNLPDAARIHALSWQESHRAFCSPEFVEAHTPERQAAYIREGVSRGKRFYLLEDEKPLAVVSVEDSMIADLYVLPDCQGRGYGSALLAYAMTLCTAQPTLTVLNNNSRAMQLYRRMGFRESGRTIPLTNSLYEIEMIHDES